MIGIKDIEKCMERHIVEGRKAVCERLGYDADTIQANFEQYYSEDVVPTLVGFIAIGIEIGMELAKGKQQATLDSHHGPALKYDEFLQSLPEYDAERDSFAPHD